MVQKIRFTLFPDFKTNFYETTIYGEILWEVSTFGFLSQKNVLFVEQFCIFETFRNSQLQRRFNLSFWQTSEQVYRKLQHGKKNLCKVSKPASPSQNIGFTFLDQIWHYKDLNQYSTAQKIWFTLHTDFKSYL